MFLKLPNTIDIIRSIAKNAIFLRYFIKGTKIKMSHIILFVYLKNFETKGEVSL